MAIYKIGVLEGDGIGGEIVPATTSILEAAAKQLGGITFEWGDFPIGWKAIEQHNDPIPNVTKEGLKDCHGWIMGPHDSAAYPESHKTVRNPSGELRHLFDLYANIRPAKTTPGTKSGVDHTDLVIFRENTEGFYADRNMYSGTGEWQITPEVVVSTGVFTKKAIERIAHAAFKMAMKRRKKVTVVHKANVIKLGSGLFLNTCHEVAEQYPEVVVDDYHIDAMAAHLVRRADAFDVIVTENMYGDILSDLAGELVGSLGLAPSINTNDHLVMAQAAHGSAPDIAGKNISNPIGIIQSATMMLNWLGERHNDRSLFDGARMIELALAEALQEGVCTLDLGGSETTSSFTEAIVNKIEKVVIP
ncbi:isocitrate/isopropylmalate dehydrogenase family protein [Salicibibacter kimchii]|uniref:Isocitrate/isopropylmalate dehydrogenase family protein n=1 Tax=Salicibibacter kimchii TaxID=2099786 RepID=A0A345C4B2_9BACI|nr:isocitrate/isopropylmalate dehydrogenase family protein [Salicibibacter kimchii]AXF58043.1 isocitrate/isopropylmalate dehydrogenase family protein [Salicibibacter kimchii]